MLSHLLQFPTGYEHVKKLKRRATDWPDGNPPKCSLVDNKLHVVECVDFACMFIWKLSSLDISI